MFWILAPFFFLPLLLTSHYNPNNYNGRCPTDQQQHDKNIQLRRLEPQNIEFKFWLKALTLIQNQSGNPRYAGLLREFHEAVAHRDARGVINFSKYMPSLSSRTYTGTLREIVGIIIDIDLGCDGKDVLRRLIESARDVVNLRQSQLDKNRNKSDKKNRECHQFALELWRDDVLGVLIRRLHQLDDCYDELRK